MLATAPGKRPGLSLLEVIVSLAIFLFSIVAINRLLTFGNERALDTRYYQHAAFLCQGKMAQLAVGYISLQNQSDTKFSDGGVEDWYWSLNCSQDGTAQGLWRVQVTVYRDTPYGQRISVMLNNMLIDPAMRGSTFDQPPQSAVQSSSSSSSGGN